MASISYRDVIGPSFYRAWNDFLRGWYIDRYGVKRDLREQVFSGGRGCIDGDSILDTPSGKVMIKNFAGGLVYAYDGKGIVECEACKPIRYTKEKLYKVLLSDGSNILCTDEHKFLTPFGWKMEKELKPGDCVFHTASLPKTCHDLHTLHLSNVSRFLDASSRDIQAKRKSFYTSHLPIHLSSLETNDHGHLQTSCEGFLSELHEDALHSMRILLGCLYRYWQDSRLCDGQPPTEGDTYRDILQQLACGHEQNGDVYLHTDDLDSEQVSNLLAFYVHRLSTSVVLLFDEYICSKGAESCNGDKFYKLLSQSFQVVLRCLSNGSLHEQVRTLSELLLLFCNEAKSRGENLQKLFCMPLQNVVDTTLSDSFQHNIIHDVDFYDRHYIKCDNIMSMEYIKTDYYYDMFVPFYNNYIANGIINHNSLKSSAVSIFLILGLERDAREAYQHKVDGDPRWKSYLTHGIVFRKFASDLATSVFGQMQWAISKLGLDDMYICTKSPLKIVRRMTGQTLLFRGLDDPTKVKSLKPPSGYGYFKYLWCEEWDQFDGMEEIRSVRQSVLRGGHKFQTFYSFNPPETSANWANFEVAKEVEGRIVYKSDYRSVPKEWLGENFFVEAENLRKDNDRAFRHEYLGEVTGNGGSVFPNLVARSIGDAELKCYDRLYLGLDFGFALSPSAFVALYYDKNHHRIIIFDEIYKQNLRNIELAEMIKERPYVGFNYIMCDSAEPKSIADLEAYGVNALPVVKVERRFGFKWLQSLNEIVIDQARTPHAFEEYSLAEYGKSKSGEFISKYPEENDHLLDGTRYATSEIAAQSGFC